MSKASAAWECILFFFFAKQAETIKQVNGMHLRWYVELLCLGTYMSCSKCWCFFCFDVPQSINSVPCQEAREWTKSDDVPTVRITEWSSHLLYDSRIPKVCVLVSSLKDGKQILSASQSSQWTVEMVFYSQFPPIVSEEQPQSSDSENPNRPEEKAILCAGSQCRFLYATN